MSLKKLRRFFSSFNIRLRLALIFVLIFGTTTILFNTFLFVSMIQTLQQDFDDALFNYAVDISGSIDIGVKAEFYEMIGELAASGRAILLISSELPELLALSDRVLVMSEGRLTADLPRGQATEESVMQAAVPRTKASARAAA